MKENRSLVWAMLIISFVLWAGSSAAEERVNGKVKSIDLATNTVVITSYEGADVTVVVQDALTLSKLKDRRIRVDDEVKVRYKKVDGRNIATYFIKPAGC